MNKIFLVLHISLRIYACEYEAKDDSLEGVRADFLRGIPDIVSGDSYESRELVYYCTQEAESAESEDCPWEDSSSSGFGEYRLWPCTLPLKKENNDHNFCCSLEATKHKEDSCVNHRRINKALFIQCCVQAFKNNTLDKQPFHDLVERFKNDLLKKRTGTLDNKTMIYLTKKDLSHRLLSYIPIIRNLWHEELCVINGKFVRLKQAAYNFQENPVEECNKKEKWLSKYSGKELKTCDYEFEDDQEHHEKVVKEFELLLQK